MIVSMLIDETEHETNNRFKKIWMILKVMVLL